MKNFNLIKRLFMDSHEKQSPQRFGRYAAMLIMLLTLGVGQMWGVSICKTGTTYIYLDRTNMTSWTTSGNTYLVWRYDNSAYRAQTSNIANTKLALWYGSTGWDNITHIGYMYGSWGASGSDTWSNITDWAPDYTNSYNGSFGFNNGNYSVVSATGSSKDWTLSPTYMGTTASSMNKTITVKAKVSTDGGSTYSETTSPGTLSASSNKFTAYNSCASGQSLSSGTITCGYTATTTLTAADATGYDFVGWYNSSGTQQTTSKTLTIYPTADATYYAYYKEKQYSLTFSHNGHGSIAVADNTVSSGSTANVNYFTTMTLVATPADGYHFTGWTLSGTNTGSVTIGNAANESTTIKATNTGATVTAGFEVDAANYTITYGVGTSYTSYGSVTEGHSYASGSSQTSGTEISLTATPVTHYKLEGWYSDAACSSAIAGAGTTNPYEFTLGANTSVYAKFVLKQCTITLDRNGGSAGATSVTALHGQTLPAFTAHTRTGYTLNGYYTETSGGTKIINADGSLVAGTSYANGSKQWNSDVTTLTLHAQWTEVKSTVSLVASPTGAGTFTSGGTVTSVQAGVATKPSVTANPAFGYSFSSWAVSGGATISSTSSNPTTVTGKGAGAAATLTATFARTYSYMQGRMSIYNAARNSKTHIASSEGGWDTNSTRIGLDYDDTNHRFVLHTHMKPSELTAQQNSEYQWFKIKNGSTTYAPTSDTQITKAGTKYSASSSGSGSYRINNAATSGYVVLHFDGSDVWYTLEQRLQYSKNGGTGSNPTGANGHNSYHATGTNATAANNPYTRTGYTFASWNTKSNGNGTNYAEGANVPMSADVTLYAKWTANPYTVVLDKQTSAEGYGGNAGTVANQTVTFDATPATVSGTMPTAAQGYGFMGFYSEAGGNGRRFIDPSGNWVTSAGDTISGGKWVKPAGITLYAYYKKAEITALTLVDAIVAPDVADAVKVTPTVEPTPAGTTHIDWRVLYSNGNPLASQPSMSVYNTTGVQFTSPATSGTYLIEAVLRTGSTAKAGTTIDSTTVLFHVAGDHTVTVQYKDAEGATIAASTNVTGKPLAWSDDITAPTFFGYSFTRWDAGDGVTIKDGSGEDKTTSTSATIKIKAVYDGKLTAVYTPKSMIFFKNTLGWSDVYVNFYSGSYWNATNGSGNKSVANRNKHMTRLGETDIWYFDYGAASITNPSLYVSFTSASQENKENFESGASVVYPANYYQNKIGEDHSAENGFKSATPMFVPLAGQSKTTMNSKADYYNRGYWTKYLPGTGYTLRIYNSAGSTLLKSIEFTSEDELMPMKAVVDLEAGQTYKFLILRGTSSVGIELGTTSNSNMTNDNHSNWQLSHQATFNKLGVVTSAAGDYTFTLTFANTNNNDDHRYRISVDYPAATGDFQILYNDRATWSHSAHNASWYHPSRMISARANGKDTISFYVYKNANTILKARKVKSITASTGAITWEAVNIGSSASMSLSGVAKTGIYNFEVVQNSTGTAITAINNLGEYTGNFYIRTDAANSKWDNYSTDGDHLMTYSEYSIDHGGYSHYYTHWVKCSDTGRKNVKFCIANDYSPCISDTLAREAASGDWANIDTYMFEGGDLKRDANVRFMWNQSTNKLSRAYIDGAQEGGYDFLVLLNTDSPNKIRWADESPLTSNKVTFSDNENWIYEAEIQAQPNAKIQLKSTWGTGGTAIVQYFKGSSSTSETLVGGSGSDWYPIRLIYDFKTNRLVASYIPASGNITTNIAINADVMFIREHQGDVAQLTFSGSGAISDIKTAYGVLRLNKWTLNNKSKTGTHSPLSPLLSRYERDLFYISFPFKVAMSEVFGFGTYGKHWIIEEYDGAGRAANGYWAESGPNWKFVWDRQGKFFEPNQGYIIALELDEMGEESEVWGPDSRSSQVELYFPSYGSMPTITNSTVNCTIPEHPCTINRSKEIGGDGQELGPEYDRRVKDSNWNVISVPTYVNTNNASYNNTSWITTVGPEFLYEWNSADNSVTARSYVGYTYKAMHAYLVQYCGLITWTTSVSPAAAPRRNPAYRGNYEFRLEILQNDEAADQTFVKLSDEEAVTTSFEFNYDLSKEFNKNRSNIYTLIGTEPAAGNVLPLTDQTTVVPVGVIAKTDGDYTFSIPDGTEGIGVTLIDNETGIRTSLSAVDYTINLSAGTYDDRFLLEISPIKHVATDIETVNEEGVATNGARKIMIDGLLYIVKDGKVFDAQGRQVK